MSTATRRHRYRCADGHETTSPRQLDACPHCCHGRPCPAPLRALGVPKQDKHRD